MFKTMGFLLVTAIFFLNLIISVDSYFGKGFFAIILAVIILNIFYEAYKIYEYLYFNGEDFKEIKKHVENHVNNCNELNLHIEDLKLSSSIIKSNDYGESNLYDNSNFKFKRNEWKNHIKNHIVHNCSASVCKNANDQPFKYLCKYFDIEINENSLSLFESLLNDLSAAEQGKILLSNERDLIFESIKYTIPELILKNNSKEKLIKKLGFEHIDLSDLHFPMYTFQYVSAGGNSSLKCDIKLNIENLDKFIRYLNDLIKFRKTIAGQRALMTSALREKIKIRDDFTCKICGLSTSHERNLLLEIDHIIPLSKGGITSEENLQTLCWKCNRTKGSKII